MRTPKKHGRPSNQQELGLRAPHRQSMTQLHQHLIDVLRTEHHPIIPAKSTGLSSRLEWFIRTLRRQGGPRLLHVAPRIRTAQSQEARYRRTARGKQIARMSRGQATAISSECWTIHEPPSPPVGFPKSGRAAVTVADNGVHSASTPSQPGLV